MNGKQIRPGFTITAPVTRQVSIDDANKYRDYGRYGGYACLGFLVIGFICAVRINADTLPVWATFDILVLTTHLPLLNIAIPGSTSIMLTEMAKILRFSFIPLDEWLVDAFDVGSVLLAHVGSGTGFQGVPLVLSGGKLLLQNGELIMLSL